MRTEGCVQRDGGTPKPDGRSGVGTRSGWPVRAGRGARAVMAGTSLLIGMVAFAELGAAAVGQDGRRSSRGDGTDPRARGSHLVTWRGLESDEFHAGGRRLVHAEDPGP